MGLIDCPKCGEKITTTAVKCVHCGSKIKKKIGKKKLLGMLLAVLVLGGIVCVLLSRYTIALRAMKILEADYGKEVNVLTIFYNEEYNGCYIEFTSGGIEDSACVHFDKGTIGYESVWNIMADKSKNTMLSKEQRKRYAQEAMTYMELYSTLWSYDIFINGTIDSGWTIVYDND